ncbi:PREDICTED: transmembrane protein 158 [Nanorana parkeri]|uniref:transmembrane protein 158 n=1 Tax=Nanorana parkeri TaxID=125878 RepID=UPI000854F5F2|nr:PREDICTED: transmembrane protein 158 [Nanorana parkeri]
MRVLRLCPPSSLLQGLVALLAICIQPPTEGWSQEGHTEEDIFLLPINASSRSLANLEFDLQTEKRTTVEESGKEPKPGHIKKLPSSSPSPVPSASNTWENSRETLILSPQTHQEFHASQSQQHGSAHCNISVQRLMLTSLLVRWGRQLGFQCDLLLFSTNNHGRAFFSAAYNRVVSPVVIEHLGVSGAQQEFRLCIGCGWSRSRRSGHLRHQHASSAASSTFSFISSTSTDPHNSLQGESLNFCCLDFTLEELRGEQGWRMNRKPIESTLVACFMTLVIIVWSVAALIWPVPIIAGFLPNGMEQRRTSSK